MNWRTEIDDINIPFKVNHRTKLLSLGSCFSEAIGQRFHQSKFLIDVNPFGVLFNPISIAQLFLEDSFFEDHFIESNELFYHLDIHSSIKGATKDGLREKLRNLKVTFDKKVEQSEVIFITFGTAAVFDFLRTKRTIANCQKISSQEFKKRFLSTEEILNSFNKVIEKYPSKQFVFTVSPVRHTREGLSENMFSKSVLRVACAELEKYTNAHYFPSYEIMLDDLRDYRFYNDDLIHVNKQGEDYIWGKVKNALFDDSTKQFLIAIEKIQRKIDHRPFNPNSKAHLTFLERTLSELIALSELLDYQEEIKIIRGEISKVSL